MKVRLTFKEVVLLHDAHVNKIVHGEDHHAELLREHVADFVAFFAKVMQRAAAKPVVTFSSLQARAFMQLWINQPLPANAGAYVILDIIELLDKASKRGRYKILNEGLIQL